MCYLYLDIARVPVWRERIVPKVQLPGVSDNLAQEVLP